jgi:hypothetical protein
MNDFERETRATCTERINQEVAVIEEKLKGKKAKLKDERKRVEELSS